MIEKGLTRRNDVRGGISMHWVVNSGACSWKHSDDGFSDLRRVENKDEERNEKGWIINLNIPSFPSSPFLPSSST